MAVFRYRMQNIVAIKAKLETQAKMEYASANARLRDEEEKLEALYRRKEEYEAEGRRLMECNLVVRDIMDNKTAVLRMDEYINAQLQQVRTAEREAEAARYRLQQAMQDRQIHEKLREKAFEAFMQEENAKESKEIDELTSYTYGQRLEEE